VVTRHARDIAIAAQDLVEGERLTEASQLRPNFRRVWQSNDAAASGQLSHELRGAGRHHVRERAARC
jgi:hypothetical protein